MLSTLLKRDITQDIQFLTQVRDTVGQALSKEDQEFVITHLLSGLEFIKTDKGKKALQSFVKDWRTYKEPT